MKGLMYCSECGNELNKKAVFCTNCGILIKKPQSNSLLKLQKIYNYTGNISIAFAVFGFISGMAFGFKPENLFTDILVALSYNFPRFYFGMKLKQVGIHNLKYSYKVSLGMFIYSLVTSFINIILGSGWFYIVLIYFYYKSYFETKKIMNIQRN